MCGGKVSPEEEAIAAESKNIDKQLKAEELELIKVNKTTTKILLLGAGESGKSTILKQFKLIYGSGFTDEDVKSYKAAIRGNLVICAKSLVEAMDTLKIPYGFNPKDPANTALLNESNELTSASNEAKSPHQRKRTESNSKESSDGNKIVKSDDPLAQLAAKLYDIAGGSTSSPPAATLIKGAIIFHADSLADSEIAAIKTIWKDSGIQYCYRRANEYQLLDSCAYFMNDLDRLLDQKYTPTQQDILQARITTTGVSEHHFIISKDQSYRIFDVGGQRSERRKWAPHFEDVNAIIFLIAISAFDQTCTEDNETNRTIHFSVVESLNLFQSICNHAMFRTTSMVVFMNKIDIFKDKLETVKVSSYFPDFTGANTYEAASEYFAHRVTESNKYTESKNVYIYYTWATDTSQIRTVFLTVNVILLQSQLASVGMI
ncbi:guanine nucleotide-binding protein G(t) subunit alpha-1-like protein [Rhizoclosmatium globosum]|uniref:Guanine nucleotide-binding protein G(T) subunit alpha-1-like protein n=1 Tax=Rhizoclosmatium globosum TaxID=329046 RepID=A0A1Y2CX75_9FUNG|nr:guanine nucleotide-binding protein G(t) subunit alpha-1-like protein [Rhizoclosmatium globosum]|eukprot:ORY51632.1 guanine nucleotide-binding protein G(t) subunit alpha-1-like protein [Rhizoclosmatium globosum]